MYLYCLQKLEQCVHILQNVRIYIYACFEQVGKIRIFLIFFSELVYYSFYCYLANGCSDAYLQEKYYLFIDHIPSMGFNWHTYYDVEESLHVYCQSGKYPAVKTV